MTLSSSLLTLLVLGAGKPVAVEEKPASAVQASTAVELEKLGGLPIEVVLKPDDDALKSPEFGAHCEKLLIEALAKHGVKARSADAKKKPPLLLRVEVSGGVTDQDAVVSGRRVAVTLKAAATLRHQKLDLRRFTVRSRYTRDSVENAGAYAMKHAASEIGPQLVTALDAWAKK